MPSIRFSSYYTKLWRQHSAELLMVKPIMIDRKTNRDLLEYDTKTIAGDYYRLKPGKYIQLVFLGDKGIPFCTIRAAWPLGKIRYYRSMIGQQFGIEVCGECVGCVVSDKGETKECLNGK